MVSAPRGATERLSPGALLVTDGKTLDVELTGSGSGTRENWQRIVDQPTGCDTTAVVSDEDGDDVRRVMKQRLDEVERQGDGRSSPGSAARGCSGVT